jgi:hypothetical protein
MMAFEPNMWPVEPPPFKHMGTPDDGPHQALWWDDVLYVTNTQKNRVEYWREGTESCNWIAHDPHDDDRDHINSLWRDPDSNTLWIAEHRKELLPKRLRVVRLEDHSPVTIVTIDIPELAEPPVHSGLHNVYVENDNIYTLGPSQILVIREGEETKWVRPYGVVKYKHYLRGLARNENHFFVGVSNASPRDRRGWGASKILILNDDLNLLHTIKLSPRFGQIMEIRLLEGDLAHNGLTCPL